MNILGIESSCDETSASVIKDGKQVLSNVIFSQIELHKKYGGVVPEVASRNHIENICLVVDEALEIANLKLSDIDAIAVTYGPGLVGALLVGLNYGKSLAYALGKPLVGVHHIEGHIAANYITHIDLNPPFLSLVVSGGHSHLVLVKDYINFEVIGRTRDDAVGEAFDKVARVMGIGYPGGPIIDKLAKLGQPIYKLPKTYFDNLDFSFSGIKTAVLNFINNHKEYSKEDLAASFQYAVTEVLVTNTIKAAKMHEMKKVVLAGGVAASSFLRESLKNECEKNNIKFYCPEFSVCTDNAAMIASQGYLNLINNRNIAKLDLNAIPNLKIGDSL